MTTFATDLPAGFLTTAGRGAHEVVRAGAGEGEDEDRDRVRRARDGDRDAFRELVDRHRDRAFEMALRIVRSREEADEVTQDAFVRAWRALDGFREEARFSTWLTRIVTRCALDAAGRMQRRRQRETAASPEAIESAAAPEAAPTDRRRLHRALGALTPIQRAVVTLFYLRDRPVAEIADILRMPAGTVKTHLHRSRGILRQAWLRQDPEGQRR